MRESTIAVQNSAWALTRAPARSSWDDPDQAIAFGLTSVSRETQARLELFVAELRRWQAIKNLVGPSTLGQVWTRHVADSLQLLDHAPAQASRWVDLGSGAGFPGLVIALADDAERNLDLVESNGRKCAFLRHAVRVTGARARVREGRIESMVGALDHGVEVVTARALAPLATLLNLSAPLLKGGAVGLFPKGRGVEQELTEAAECWRFDADLLPSRTDPDGRIVRVTGLDERRKP